MLIVDFVGVVREFRGPILSALKIQMVANMNLNAQVWLSL